MTRRLLARISSSIPSLLVKPELHGAFGGGPQLDQTSNPLLVWPEYHQHGFGKQIGLCDHSHALALFNADELGPVVRPMHHEIDRQAAIPLLCLR